MKKLTAIMLIVCTLVLLSSCGLIRKATANPSEQSDAEIETAPEESYATDFSETDKPSDNKPLRYTEDEAYELLSHSFPDYDPKLVKIERTGAIVADDNGTEYYIFSVSLPKKAETSSDGSTKAVEYDDAIPYYVSVNGVAYSELVGNNVDTKYAEGAFASKYGKTSEGGNEYRLVYEGLFTSRDTLCYNFAVYEAAPGGDVYAFNYLVTVDGAYSAEMKTEH